jgi:cobalamin biosynthesis protein CbiD
MRLLTKADVFAAADLPTEDVPVPEWGTDAGVRVRSLSCEEHRSFARRVKDMADDAEVTAHLLVACAVDEAGQPVFTMADLPALLKKSAAVVKRVGQAAMKLNRIGPAALEDARKNS